MRRDLLTHVNPYTGHPYTHEPAIAFIEINNENALHSTWGWGQIDTLPQPYAGTFQALWNAWLKKKYGTTERLGKAWNAEAVPIGRELFQNGHFQADLRNSWNLERDDDDQAGWSIQKNGPQGRDFLRIVVNRRGGVSWHPQLSQGGLAMRKDAPYTLSFRMRAQANARVQLNAMQAHDPWKQLGFSAEARLGPEWKQFGFTFTVEEDDSNADHLDGPEAGHVRPGRCIPAAGRRSRRGAEREPGRFHHPRHEERVDEPDPDGPPRLHGLPLGHRGPLLVGNVPVSQG